MFRIEGSPDGHCRCRGGEEKGRRGKEGGKRITTNEVTAVPCKEGISLGICKGLNLPNHAYRLMLAASHQEEEEEGKETEKGRRGKTKGRRGMFDKAL